MKVTTLILLLFISMNSFAQLKVYVQKSATVSRGHIVTFPQGYQPTGGPGYPLLIFLHGSGQRGDQTTGLTRVEETGLPEVMNGPLWDKTLPFIVVAPQLTTGDWWDGQVTEIYDYAVNNYNVDINRVYYTGLSLGAMGSWGAMAVPNLNTKIAAYIIISGKGVVWDALCGQLRDVGVWDFHGTGDGTFKISEAIGGVYSFNACSPTIPAKLTSMPGGHDYTVWNTVYENLHGSSNKGYDGKTYNNIYKWLLSFSLNNSPSPPTNKPPVASAGADKAITLPINSLSITGFGSDSDGTVASYAWTKISGGSAVLGVINTSTLTLSGLAQGSYVFRLTVTDNLGAQAFDDMSVVVNPAPNSPPLANAGADKAITLPINSLSITGFGSDSDGSIASYAWTKISGGSAVLGVINTSTLTLSGLAQGSYVFRLTVTDNLGAQAFDDVSVVVNPAIIASSDPSLSYTGTANYGINMLWYDPAENPWSSTSRVDVTASGNNAVEFYIRQTPTAGMLRIEIGDHVAPTQGLDLVNVASSFTKITIPLSSFSSAPLKAVRFIVFRSEPFKDVEVRGIRFVGGVTPFVYFGAEHPSVGLDPSWVYKPGSVLNNSPVANAGADKAITLPINSLSITGFGSDSDGSIASYAWTKISGGSALLGGINTSSLTLSGLSQGSYVFRLTVTDNLGAQAFDDVSVVVNPAPNSPPLANAGADQSILLPANALNLIGSGSDSDGTIASYSWIKVSGGVANLSGTGSSTLALSGLAEGNYVFRLTVTDNLGAQASDEVSVVVVPLPSSGGANLALNRPAFASSLEWGDLQYSALFAVDGNSSTTRWSSGRSDPQWIYVDLGSVQSISRVKIIWEAASAANYVIQTSLDAVSWTDIKNITGNSTLINDHNSLTGTGRYLRVFGTTRNTIYGYSIYELEVYGSTTPANNPPQASAGADKAITLPINSLSITGFGSDSDGTVASYAWTKISGGSAVLGVINTSTLTLSGLAQGSYVFRLTVTDNLGAQAFDDMSVVVNPAPNSPPLANAGADKAITLPINSLSITGFGSDSDGSIASYAWTKISGGSAVLGVINTSTLTLSGLAQGSYVFRLTVTDNLGAQAFDDVSVVVNPAAVYSKIKIDIGENLASAPDENSVALAQKNSLILLKDVSGQSSGISILVSGFNLTNPNGTTTPAAALGISSEMSRDSFYGNTAVFQGATAPQGFVTLSGLVPGGDYSVSMFASRMDVTDNRQTQYVVQGASQFTVYLDVHNNTDKLASVDLIKADSSGKITITVSKGPSNTNSNSFYYLGGIILQRK